MRARDWFTVPVGAAVYIVDTTQTKLAMNDASRPYVVIERYYAGYQNGMRTIVRGRYNNLDAAKRRVRYCENNG